MAIKCCKGCVPPTRYLGCHDRCNKYLEEKAKLEEEKILMRKEKGYIIYPNNAETQAYPHKPHKNKHDK